MKTGRGFLGSLRLSAFRIKLILGLLFFELRFNGESPGGRPLSRYHSPVSRSCSSSCCRCPAADRDTSPTFTGTPLSARWRLGAPLKQSNSGRGDRSLRLSSAAPRLCCSVSLRSATRCCGCRRAPLHYDRPAAAPCLGVRLLLLLLPPPPSPRWLSGLSAARQRPPPADSGSGRE